MTDFIATHRALPLEDRIQQANHQMSRDDRVPVILDIRGNNMSLTRHKFAVPVEKTIMGLQAVVRKYCTALHPQESLTSFILAYKTENGPPEEILVLVSDSLGTVYQRYASADKHLYCLFVCENSFGH